jgi:hypothetical protein
MQATPPSYRRSSSSAFETKVCSGSRQVSLACETCFRRSCVPACLSRGVALVTMSSAAWLGVCLSDACVSALRSGLLSICFFFPLFLSLCSLLWLLGNVASNIRGACSLKKKKEKHFYVLLVLKSGPKSHRDFLLSFIFTMSPY